MRAAVDSEDAHSRNPLPANRLYPMHELLAEMLARFNEPARAAQLIGDQQQKTGAAGAVPAARIASRCCGVANAVGTLVGMRSDSRCCRSGSSCEVTVLHRALDRLWKGGRQRHTTVSIDAPSDG